MTDDAATPPKSPNEDMFAGLELDDGDLVSQCVLIAKVVNMETGKISVSISLSDGADWLDQIGLIESARQIGVSSPWEDR